MQAFSMTDIGRHRKMNQDYVYISQRPVGNLPNLFIVADGMGGHNAGEYASRHTVNTIVSSAAISAHTQPAAILGEAIKAANQELIRQAALDRSMWGMGTTVVAVAEIMIACYAAFMIFSGVFTIISYVKAKAQNNLMKVCLIVNSLYAVAGVVFLGMMINTKLM